MLRNPILLGYLVLQERHLNFGRGLLCYSCNFLPVKALFLDPFIDSSKRLHQKDKESITLVAILNCLEATHNFS